MAGIRTSRCPAHGDSGRASCPCRAQLRKIGLSAVLPAPRFRFPGRRPCSLSSGIFSVLSDLLPIHEALTSGACLLLVLSKPRRRSDPQCTKVSIRPVEIQQRTQYQFTSHFADRVTHANFDEASAAGRAVELLCDEFEHAALFTPAADSVFRAQAGGGFRVRSSRPTRAAAPREHNRTKAYLLPEGIPCPFLIEMGVMSADGRVRAPLQHKFRQINRFLELVEDIVPALPTEGELRVVDFGCGKSYLTFALHHLLTVRHGRQVRLVGLDRKADVIRQCTDVARRLDCRGLEFREGEIGRHFETGSVDLAVSLHACDTATDDALARALEWNCAVILAVPCCQHELSEQLAMPPLAPLLRHGILRERFAALATDALRAQVLEIQGYATQIVEFIDMEHTAKNLLIRAVRRTQPDGHHAERLREYAACRHLLGIDSTCLERLLPPGALDGAPPL